MPTMLVKHLPRALPKEYKTKKRKKLVKDLRKLYPKANSIRLGQFGSIAFIRIDDIVDYNRAVRRTRGIKFRSRYLKVKNHSI